MQSDFLNRQFGSVRFVYNTGLRIISHRYRRHAQSLSAKHDIKKLLPIAKKSRRYGWLKDVDAAKVVGLDMGLSHLAIDSTRRKIANPRFLKQAQRNLKRQQQALSRAKKGSANRAKARLLVAKAHERVANARNDFQHKLSRQIVDDNQAVIVETLKVRNKHKVDAIPLNTRSWECPACHIRHDRDCSGGERQQTAQGNAGENRRRAGHHQAPCQTSQHVNDYCRYQTVLTCR